MLELLFLLFLATKNIFYIIGVYTVIKYVYTQGWKKDYKRITKKVDKFRKEDCIIQEPWWITNRKQNKK